jgi:glucokinase
VLLTGDIGGTKTELAYFEAVDGQLKLGQHERYPSHDHTTLDEIVATFVAEHPAPIERAAFGIAGPVVKGRATTTNLPWTVEADSLAHLLQLDHVALINDLEAVAYGTTMLGADDVVVLNRGRWDATGTVAVIAAGTGLGEAGLWWDGRQHWPFSSEGGHCEFAPRDELELDMLRFMQAEFGHVSYERILSGPGLVNVYRFLRDTGRASEPSWLADELRQDDAAAAISAAGVAGTSPLCVQALHVFVSVYGAQAGNLALTINSAGGVFIGGGIAPKILPVLQLPLFMQAFTSKGRLSEILEAMPVKVIVNSTTPLLGAARAAQLL